MSAGVEKIVMACLLAPTGRYYSSQEEWRTGKLRQQHGKSLSRSVFHRSFGTTLRRQQYRSVGRCLHRSSEESGYERMDPHLGRVRESIYASRTCMRILGHSLFFFLRKTDGSG